MRCRHLFQTSTILTRSARSETRPRNGASVLVVMPVSTSSRNSGPIFARRSSNNRSWSPSSYRLIPRYNRNRNHMEDLKKKLQDEITALENELRIELPREILKAREHGDLSENAEYHAAKERQAYVNAR